MIKFLFLTIPNQCTYDNLKAPLKFKQDVYGVSTWTMKHPLTIFSADLKYKHVFKQNDVKIQPVNNPGLQQKWKYFVITKGDGGKYYQNFHYLVKGITKNFFIPPSISIFFFLFKFYGIIFNSIILSSKMHRNDILQVNLLKIHKQLKKNEPAISYCIEQDLYELYLDYLQTGRQKQWDHVNLQQISSKRKSYCPLEVSFSYYVECCNNHSTGQCIYIQKTSSRQVLHLYKLNPSSLYQIGYFFHLPFSSFSLRKILSAVLTQKQLVFTSSNANLTVMVIETIMQMILPLKWCYMYAPNLPVELIQAVQQSFMPFIAGISKQYMPLISKANKIIVHIDTDEIEINYQQQEQQLNFLSKKFERFLTWKANSNKQYLEWEKELRINSILMITTIFKKDFNSSNQKPSSATQYFSDEQKMSQIRFYEQFLHKSMMYRKLIEDVHENVYSQFYKLTKMDYNERKVFLQNKFNSLHSQTIYPMKCDNKKKWIKFYEKYMRQKRKTRLNRHSLSMVEHNLIGIGANNNSNQPFYASNVSLSSINSSNRIQSSNRIDRGQKNQNSSNYPNKNMNFRGSVNNINNIANINNNQLYQSTISSNSLNSQSSALKFNTQGTPATNNNSVPKNVFGSNFRGSNMNNNANSNNSLHYNGNSMGNFNNNIPLGQNIGNGFQNNQNPYQSMTNRNNLNSNQQSSLQIGNNQISNTLKGNPHNSMIVNTNVHPLNQSMVASFISPGPNNVNAYQAMGAINSMASHRNLNTTQSSVAL